MSLLLSLRSPVNKLIIDEVSVATVFQTTDVSTTLTSASFTPLSSSQLMLVCANLNQSVATNTFTISDSVNGSSGWTQAVLKDGSNSTYLGSAAIWYRQAGSTAPRTITMTDNVGRTKSFKTYLITGQDLTTPIGASGTGALSASSNSVSGYTSTAANSVGFISATEYLGNNPFLISTDNDDLYYLSARYAALAGYKNSITAPVGTAVTFDIQIAGTALNINYAVIEINRAVTNLQITYPQFLLTMI